MSDCSLFVYSSTFIRNHAISNIVGSGSFGTIDFIDGITLICVKSFFIDNLKFIGGAIAITITGNEINTTLVFISNCTFLNNSASNGASVYIVNSYKIEIFCYQSNFFLNWARNSKKIFVEK